MATGSFQTQNLTAIRSGRRSGDRSRPATHSEGARMQRKKKSAVSHTATVCLSIFLFGFPALSSAAASQQVDPGAFNDPVDSAAMSSPLAPVPRNNELNLLRGNLQSIEAQTGYEAQDNRAQNGERHSILVQPEFPRTQTAQANGMQGSLQPMSGQTGSPEAGTDARGTFASQALAPQGLSPQRLAPRSPASRAGSTASSDVMPAGPEPSRFAQPGPGSSTQPQFQRQPQSMQVRPVSPDQFTSPGQGARDQFASPRALPRSEDRSLVQDPYEVQPASYQQDSTFQPQTNRANQAQPVRHSNPGVQPGGGQRTTPGGFGSAQQDNRAWTNQPQNSQPQNNRALNNPGANNLRGRNNSGNQNPGTQRQQEVGAQNAPAPAIDPSVARSILKQYELNGTADPLPGQPIRLIDLMMRTPLHQRRAMINQYWETYYDWANLTAARQHLQTLAQIPAPQEPSGLGLLNAARSHAENDILADEIQLVKSQSKLQDFWLQGMPAGNAMLPLPSDTPLVQEYETHYDWYASRGMLPQRLRGFDQVLPKALQLIADRGNTVRTAKSAMNQARSSRGGVSAMLSAADLCKRSEESMIASVVNYNRAIADYSLAIAPPHSSPDQVVSMLVNVPTNSPAVANLDPSGFPGTANGFQNSTGPFNGSQVNHQVGNRVPSLPATMQGQTNLQPVSNQTFNGQPASSQQMHDQQPSNGQPNGIRFNGNGAGNQGVVDNRYNAAQHTNNPSSNASYNSPEYQRVNNAASQSPAQGELRRTGNALNQNQHGVPQMSPAGQPQTTPAQTPPARTDPFATPAVSGDQTARRGGLPGDSNPTGNPPARSARAPQGTLRGFSPGNQNGGNRAATGGANGSSTLSPAPPVRSGFGAGRSSGSNTPAGGNPAPASGGGGFGG